MSQVRHTDADARQALSRLFAPIATDLALVDRRLQQELRHSEQFPGAYLCAFNHTVVITGTEAAATPTPNAATGHEPAAAAATR